MPLFLQTPPLAAALVLEEGMGEAMSSATTDVYTHALAAAESGFSAAAPLPVFTVNTADIFREGDSFLADAKQVGWKYVIVQGETPTGVATLSGDMEGVVDFGKYQKDGLTGPLVAAIKVAESSTQIQAKDFMCQFLEVRPLYFAALWMHAADEDLIIPLADCAAGEIPALSIQTAETIRGVLRARLAQGSPLPARPQ
jgi:hypothetical protein